MDATPFPKSGEIFKSDDYPIKLFGSHINMPSVTEEGKKTSIEGRLEIGLLTYNHRKKPDFDALFDSKYFKAGIGNPELHSVIKDGYPILRRWKEEELKISNFYRK